MYSRYISSSKFFLYETTSKKSMKVPQNLPIKIAQLWWPLQYNLAFARATLQIYLIRFKIEDRISRKIRVENFQRCYRFDPKTSQTRSENPMTRLEISNIRSKSSGQIQITLPPIRSFQTFESVPISDIEQPYLKPDFL